MKRPTQAELGWGHPALSYRNLGFERDADVGGVSLRETAAEAEP